MASHVLQRDHLNANPAQLTGISQMRRRELVGTWECWTHAFGGECRLFAGGEMIATQVWRNDAAIEAFGSMWRRR